MADKFSKEKRHEIMSHIRAKDTKPELIVRKFLYAQGIRYRLNDKRFPGRPDIYVPRAKLAIFIHGCFWHAHENCSAFKLPKTNTEFWAEKFRKNRERDAKKIRELENLGLNWYVIWECQLKNRNQEATLEKLLGRIFARSNRDDSF